MDKPNVNKMDRPKSVKELLISPKVILALTIAFMLLIFGIMTLRLLSTKVAGVPIGAVAVVIIAIAMLAKLKNGLYHI